MCTRDNLEVIWEEWMAEYECGVRGCVRVAYLTLTSPDNKSFYLCRRHARELTRTLKKQTRRIRRGKRRVVIGGNGTMSATTGNIEVGWDEEWLPDMPCDVKGCENKAALFVAVPDMLIGDRGPGELFHLFRGGATFMRRDGQDGDPVIVNLGNKIEFQLAPDFPTYDLRVEPKRLPEGGEKR